MTAKKVGFSALMALKASDSSLGIRKVGFFVGSKSSTKLQKRSAGVSSCGHKELLGKDKGSTARPRRALNAWLPKWPIKMTSVASSLSLAVAWSYTSCMLRTVMLVSLPRLRMGTKRCE